MVYVPKLLAGVDKNEADKVARHIAEEFLRIARELQLQEFIQLKVLHASPDKPRQGMIVYADGTDWNPGSGEGVYRRSTSAWVLLG